MSTHRPNRIGRFTAERLLRGETSGPDRLNELLTAVTAPATAGELAGEEPAVAAFRRAHLVPVPQLRRRSMVKTALAKLLTLKVAAVAVTATAAGGVALAASTGHVPGTSDGTTTTKHHDASPKAGKTRHHHPDASPSPSLVGLCHAYRAGAGDNPGKALASPAFTRLITAAGGKDQVAAYCADLLKTAHSKARHHPTTSEPTSHPTGAPISHPTGAPISHPTGAPTSHATGRPLSPTG